TTVTVVLSAVLVVCMGSAVLLLRRIDRLRAGATLEEVLYIPSPKILKRMSLGYSGLVADIYWTRAVQYFGARHRARAKDYRLLGPLLDITTELDPHLIVAYRFGSAFLAQKPPEGAGQPDKAVELVERGIRANPNDWQLYYELGFLEYMELHDPGAAARAFERGSQVPSAHPFLNVLAASMAQHAGEIQMARMLWTTTLETSDDKMIQANAAKHLIALKVDEDVPRLEAIVSEYKRRSGRLPASWSELITAGLLRRIPVDPVGHSYKLMPEGRVEVADPDALPFIKQGLPPGRQPGMLVVEKQA
ncbi:MAG: tetratricopeptide repeat protein, partial [Terriglobales bacterium]